jgi:glycosyltransferase involved in cell wall biosynthesis
MARVPLVIHIRNMISAPTPGRTYRYLFNRAARCICISEAVRDAVLGSGLSTGETAKRLRVIPDARDLSTLDRGDRERFRRELGVPPDTPLIGMVARFEPFKGQDIFLEAARLVAARRPDARFVLVGGLMRESDRDYAERLERLAKAPELTGRVTSLGYRKDVPDVLAGLDCFVHSSRRGAFVSVLIEAMAAGLPIVASDVDGIPECLGRDGAATLVSPLEPAAFADAILEILQDQRRTQSMRHAAKARASSLYDAGSLAQETQLVFAECI